MYNNGPCISTLLMILLVLYPSTFITQLKQNILFFKSAKESRLVSANDISNGI